MHYFIGSGSLHLMAKRPRLSLALAALLVGGMYRGHRMVHAAAAAPVQVSASKVLPPPGDSKQATCGSDCRGTGQRQISR
jgi:hypothetical protein